MARSHLTLAALAASAVAGLTITHARPFSTGEQGDYDSAVLTEKGGGLLLVRVPNGETAEAEQAAEVAALALLSHGVRSRLPFDVPTVVGELRTKAARAIVYEFLPGRSIAPGQVPPAGPVAVSIGRTVAAIHALPTSVIVNSAFPSLSTEQCQQSTAALVEQAAGSGLLPATIRTRWEGAMADTGMWQFSPALIHGSMTSSSFLTDGESVTAVLGWASLRVGDPARDLHWLSSLHPEAQDSVFDAYAMARSSSTDQKIRQRATLYSELEVARWLLHGLEQRDTVVVDDAVQMLDRMVDSVRDDAMNPLTDATGPIMAVADVEAMLETLPGDDLNSTYTGLPPVTDDQSERSSDSE
ncbi:phosphotransferase [Homoserinimonas sp. OAct 916]|uniref:phosphotransferase n=1 Tax=Homoserinimonas sp. OAct 916 TaxID=2211450 RepID=UPI000DBE986A|nr:phosphotransferase [Homoserinimonas sp. OAct 916]